MSDNTNNYASLLKAVSGITKSYQKFCKGREVHGFNVFLAISDVYYRENFHSDFMAMLLDPSSPHQEGSLFLQGFVEMLNKKLKQDGKNRTIKGDWYGRYTQVFREVGNREKGKIDILIKGSKHLIIVENKINNAADMERQLPRYVEYVMDKYGDCTLDAIVYLPLSEKDGEGNEKKPDDSTWLPGDHEKVDGKLMIIPAYKDTDSNKVNIVENWLTPCLSNCHDTDTKSVVKQYIELVKTLNYNMKDTKDIFELAKLFENNGDYVATYQALSEMWNELCKEKLNDLVNRIGSGITNWGKFHYEPAIDYTSKYCKLGSVPVEMDGKTCYYAIAVGTFINKCCEERSCFYNVQFWNSTNYNSGGKNKDIMEELESSKFSISSDTIKSAKRYDEGGLLKCEIAWYYHLGEEDKIVSCVQDLIEGCSNQ